MVKLLMERDLPGLVSITSSPAMSATAKASIPVSTSTVYVPEIIPPSPQDNPFIYHASSMPDGVVFIAVGAIVGAIFLAIAVWWCVATVISYRNTRAANDVLTHHDYTYSIEKQPLAKANNTSNTGNNNNNNNRIISDSSSMGNFASNEYELEEKYLYPNAANTTYNDDDDDVDLQFGVQQFNAIQPDNTYNNYRNSLFISPTLQMQSGNNNNNNNNNNPYMTPRRNSAVMLDKPALAASPERKKKSKSKHKRNQSSLGLLSASPSKSAIDLSTTRGHRKSASVYLDNMLTESIDHHV